MLLSPCGANCNVCGFKQDCGGSCFACEGKACYIDITGLELCAIYDCAINKKAYKSCAECAEAPCKTFLSWKDPSISDEDFKENVDMRLDALRAENIKNYIIGLEIAALERWNNGDPDGFIELMSDDISYFDPYNNKRIDGIEAMATFYESLRGQIHVDSYEIIDPEVIIYGAMAVLSYNLNSRAEALQKTFKWNCTEVYRMEDGKWKIVHNHWSFIRPMDMEF